MLSFSDGAQLLEAILPLCIYLADFLTMQISPQAPFSWEGRALDQAPSEARGVVIGGPEYVKSCRTLLIDSEMAGPITMKLSGIDRGNSVTVLGQRN